MADVVDRATRSRMMSGIRGKNTKPELVVRSFLHRAGLRFRLHAKLPGKPDLVLPRYRTAVFVHGCFWHRHENCRYATTPANNATFWQEKFSSNVQRDRRTKQALQGLGWRVEVIWACELQERNLQALVERIRSGE
ncbi:MAG TPA: very short patch repair endonuclease [Steroidobacteraceae bacterium]|nr:very short patch repair endonuclease [Steroidobacteraceae bacterium]